MNLYLGHNLVISVHIENISLNRLKFLDLFSGISGIFTLYVFGFQLCGTSNLIPIASIGLAPSGKSPQEWFPFPSLEAVWTAHIVTTDDKHFLWITWVQIWHWYPKITIEVGPIKLGH